MFESLDSHIASNRKKLLEYENLHFETFSNCRRICRRSSKSTSQGNTYLNRRDLYCWYNDSDNMKEEHIGDLNRENSFDSLEYWSKTFNKDKKYQLIMSTVGQSCHDSCQEENSKMECVDSDNNDQFFNLWNGINTRQILQCQVTGNIDHDNDNNSISHIESRGSSSKQNKCHQFKYGYDSWFPAFDTIKKTCYLAATTKHSNFNCNSQQTSFQRMCICQKATV